MPPIKSDTPQRFKIVRHIMSSTVFIKDWLRGPYTVVSAAADSTTLKTRVPYKWLSGDIVCAETGAVISRADMRKRQIVGIIDFLNATGFGFTSRGIPLYMFHPLDRAYPPMIVSSKTKPAQNMIAVATVEHWEDKWPRAGISKILGPVGDKQIERNALFLRAGAASTVPAPEMYSATHETVDDDWDVVCNIDPDGCVDVDDVLFWKRRADDTIVFGIGIADVAAWVPEGSVTDAYAKQLGQTLYLDGTVHTPMLPTILSADLASLRSDGRARPVLALLYTIAPDGSYTKRWSQMMLRNRETFTYDSPALASLAPIIMTCLRAITSADVSTDPHEWIERAMVTYNCEAAHVLWAAGVGVLRAHAGTSDSVYASIAESTHIPEIAWLGSAAGNYVLADATVTPHHAGLGVSTYCHCSSPLRRYADLINQRWLHHILFEAPRPTATTTGADVAHLNCRATAAKALDRDVWFLDHSHTHQITEADGIVLRLRSSDYVSVYVPIWKRTVRATASSSPCAIGARVRVRMFCDLRKTSWMDRIVCSAAFTHTEKN